MVSEDSFVERAMKRSMRKAGDVTKMWHVTPHTAINYRHNPKLIPLGKLEEFYDYVDEIGKNEVKVYIQKAFDL